ncbi:MAG: carotenoid biosynthesis protein [Halanaeroarchaeum sp.]
MTGLVFVANLLVSVLALGIVATDAYPNRERLAFLAAAVPYGVLLEQLVILRFDRYEYPVEQFLLTVGDVPVVIGIGWAAIIYAGYRLAATMGLSGAARSAFVGLFALHVDLAIDAVAIRAGFWTWTPPGAWFGVPLGNFFGWFAVATLFAAGWSTVTERLERPLLGGALTVGLAVGGLVVALEIWSRIATTVPRAALVLGTVVAVALALVLADDGHLARPSWRVQAVPLLFHGYYLALLVALGIARRTPALLVVSLSMLSVSVVLHRPRVLGTTDAGARGGVWAD